MNTPYLRPNVYEDNPKFYPLLLSDILAYLKTHKMIYNITHFASNSSNEALHSMVGNLFFIFAVISITNDS